jgi:hypothetical protein
MSLSEESIFKYAFRFIVYVTIESMIKRKNRTNSTFFEEMNSDTIIDTDQSCIFLHVFERAGAP